MKTIYKSVWKNERMEIFAESGTWVEYKIKKSGLWLAGFRSPSRLSRSVNICSKKLVYGKKREIFGNIYSQQVTLLAKKYGSNCLWFLTTPANFIKVQSSQDEKWLNWNGITDILYNTYIILFSLSSFNGHTACCAYMNLS